MAIQQGTRRADWRADAACRRVDPDLFFLVGYKAQNVEGQPSPAVPELDQCPVTANVAVGAGIAGGDRGGCPRCSAGARFSILFRLGNHSHCRQVGGPAYGGPTVRALDAGGRW